MVVSVAGTNSYVRSGLLAKHTKIIAHDKWLVWAKFERLGIVRGVQTEKKKNLLFSEGVLSAMVSGP